MKNREKVIKEIMLRYNFTEKNASDLTDNLYKLWNHAFDSYIKEHNDKVK